MGFGRRNDPEENRWAISRLYHRTTKYESNHFKVSTGVILGVLYTKGW